MPEGAPGNPGAERDAPPVRQARIREVREMQAKLHRWAGEDSSRRFGDLFNLVLVHERRREYAKAVICCASTVVDEIRTREMLSVRITVKAVCFDEFDILWHIGNRSAREIVDSGHSPAEIPKALRYVTTKEPGYTGDEDLQGISSGRTDRG